MKKFFGDIFRKLNTRLNRILLLIFGLLLVISAAILLKNSAPQFVDDDPDRGAAVVKNDIFGDHYDKTVYLEQNWSKAESLWFYNTTQGSDLLPYDFFMSLEKADAEELFRSNENMNRYRYLIQKATTSNPDALPVGMVADFYKNKKYLGFTCAACHTSQVNYKGTGIRIDGDQTMADMQTFMDDLSKALSAVSKDGPKQQRFVDAVLKRGSYANKQDVLNDILVFSIRIGIDNLSNQGTKPEEQSKYGYGRLDAIGRIYNRVLITVLRKEDIQDALHGVLSEEKITSILKNLDQKIISNNSRDHLLEALATELNTAQRAAVIEKIFNPSNAPVSYPFLWDTPQHDYVQWNGFAGNAGAGPLGRNVGEVIGVFGTMDWSEADGTSLASILAGQSTLFSKSHINFYSSIKSHNLNLLETQLSKLYSPKWPEEILPKLDQKRIAAGEVVFNQYCASCHQPIVRNDPDRIVIANVSNITEIKTDPAMEHNAGNRIGYSGMLTHQYVPVGPGQLYLKGRTLVPALLLSATINSVTAATFNPPDTNVFEKWANIIYDMYINPKNPVKETTLKMGNYVPDETNAPLASWAGYKGRSLNGIWATAPYLHNGSVPTLYDLLLPACQRPITFQTGSREFDPEKVGFKNDIKDIYGGFVYDTTLPGNKNTGHDEYGSSDATCPDGSTDHHALTDEEIKNLLEYLKNQ